MLNTAHVTLDSLSGTLLVQGRVTSAGVAQNDAVTIDTVGTDIRVRLFNASMVNYATEKVPAALVSQIVVSVGGDTASPSVTGISVPVNIVHWVVSSNQDAVDIGSATDGFVDLDAIVPGNQVTLRAAVQNANGTLGGGIYIPRGRYNLTLQGSGGDTQGDLDITRSVNIYGTGAGETIIDASGLGSSFDRVFEVSGTSGASQTLTLNSVTVTGGKAPDLPGTPWLSHGGGIFVRDYGNLNLINSAVVGNQTLNSAALGGAIYFQQFGGGTITNSVITNNYSASYTGGIYLGGGVSPFSQVTVTGSIIAKNTAALPVGSQWSYDVSTELASRDFTSGGGNRIGLDNPTATVGFTAATDFSGSVDYIVSGIADTFNSTDNAIVMSTRDAIDAANTTPGPQEIWLPAWKFTLTRERNFATQLTDVDVTFGDLDIKQSLTIRGVNGSTSVSWRAGAAPDAVFDLLGDYNGDGVTTADNGTVDSADYSIWRAAIGTSNLAADGNDDGVVNNLDYGVWRDHFDNTLSLLGVV